MLEAIFGAGGADLIRDEYRILFTGWHESEVRFLALFLTLVLGSKIRQMW